MKILVLDNYDSFTYNLVHIIRALGYGEQMTIKRNNKITLEEVASFDKILLSPGPGIPEEAGIMKELIQQYGPHKSILGICLGHQGIAEVYGAALYNMTQVQHGLKGKVTLQAQDYLFEGIPTQFSIAHYHSWSVQNETVNGQLSITAVDEEGKVMGIQHNTYDVRGLQFHPESVITEYGKNIIENWLKH